jgi:hypothetical protein
MDPGTLAAILTIGTIVVGAVTGVPSHLLGRRAASGKVSTSEASVLWAQAQEMRSMLLQRGDRAEEQRDRLIEAYTTQIFPALTSMRQLIEDLSITVADGMGLIRRISASLGEEDGHAVPPERQAASRR